MGQASVSIIIPCYNAGPWLADALDSALSQSWLNKEIIVVDDGSTDDSLRIARTFESRGVRVVCQTNSGASSARNRGMAEATGDYLQFLDADDLLHPRKIESQISVLRERRAGVVASGRWGRFQVDPARTRFEESRLFSDLTGEDFLQITAREGSMMHPAAWLTPREVAHAAGRWNESLSLNDDGEFFARVVLASRGIAYCNDAVSYYRSNLSRSLSGRIDECAQRSLVRSVDLISEQMLRASNSPEMRDAVAQLFLRALHIIYPAPQTLLEHVTSKIGEYGGTLTPPPMGPRSRALSHVIGWKLTRRLQRLLRR